MKRSVRVIALLMAVVLMLAGCNGDEKAGSKMKEWEKNANLEAGETADELYEAAKNEEALKIYTVSSRLFDVAESFQDRYPELLVEVEYFRAEEIKDKLYENDKNSTYECDLIFTTNGDGNLTEDLIPNNLAYKYIPYDMKDSLREGGSEEYLSILLEVPLLTYNSAVYSSQPINSWWELTKPEWKGKLYVTDPTKSMISYTVFSMLMQNSDELEKSYEQCFGVKYDGNEDIGHAFIRMLVENDLQVLNDSDDVASAVAAPGTGSDAVGILNASKLRLNNQGYTLSAVTDMEPFAGVINPANILIAGGAKNINTAKLFIRWILGETDGTGEGYKPFLQVGAWPSRTDVAGGDDTRLEDMKVIYTDEEYTAREREAFLAFWTGLIE